MSETEAIDVLWNYMPHANTTTAACIAAVAAFIVAIINSYVVRMERKARERFEASERRARQQHDTQEREAREMFERQHTSAQSCSELSKEAWRRNIERLETASGQLSRTVAGVVMLIDEGPQLNDFRMIKETAKVLDVFGLTRTSQVPYKRCAQVSPRSHPCPSVCACERRRAMRPTARPNTLPRGCITRSHAWASMFNRHRTRASLHRSGVLPQS